MADAMPLCVLNSIRFEDLDLSNIGIFHSKQLAHHSDEHENSLGKPILA